MRLFSKKTAPEAARRQLETLIVQHDRLRAAADAAAAEATRLQALAQRLDTDPEFLLRTSEPEYARVQTEAREGLRAQARAAKSIQEFVAAHGDAQALGARLAEFDGEVEAIQQAELGERYRAKLRELLAAGEVVGRVQEEIDAMASDAARRWPAARTVGGVRLAEAAGVRPAGFPAGTFSRVDGDARPESAATLWGAARAAIGRFDAALLAESDSVRPSLGASDRLSPRVLGYVG